MELPNIKLIYRRTPIIEDTILLQKPEFIGTGSIGTVTSSNGNWLETEAIGARSGCAWNNWNYVPAKHLRARDLFFTVYVPSIYLRASDFLSYEYSHRLRSLYYTS